MLSTLRDLRLWLISRGSVREAAFESARLRGEVAYWLGVQHAPTFDNLEDELMEPSHDFDGRPAVDVLRELEHKTLEKLTKYAFPDELHHCYVAFCTINLEAEVMMLEIGAERYEELNDAQRIKISRLEAK